jgi:MFS family permease
MGNSKFKLKLGILAQPFVFPMFTVPSVLLADIGKAFQVGEEDKIKLQMIVALSMLGICISSVIAGKIAGKIRKKTLSISALAIILLSGVFVLLLHDSLAYLYIGNFICGCGAGLLLTSTTMESTMYFEGAARSKMFGNQTATQNIGSVVIKLIVGAIAGVSWIVGYYSYALVIVVILIVLAALPKDEVQQLNATEKEAENAPLPGAVYILCILAMIGIASVIGIMYYLSNYISSYEIGSTMFAAVALSLYTGMAGIAGLVFPFVLKTCRALTITAAFVIGGIGYLLLAFIPNIVAISIGAIFVGLGYGLMQTSLINATVGICTPQQTSRATGLIVGVCSFGGVFTSFIFGPLSGLFKGGADASFAFQGGHATVFMLCAFSLIIFGVIVGIWYPQVAKKKSKSTESAEA